MPNVITLDKPKLDNVRKIALQARFALKKRYNRVQPGLSMRARYASSPFDNESLFGELSSFTSRLDETIHKTTRGYYLQLPDISNSDVPVINMFSCRGAVAVSIWEDTSDELSVQSTGATIGASNRLDLHSFTFSSFVDPVEQAVQGLDVYSVLLNGKPPGTSPFEIDGTSVMFTGRTFVTESLVGHPLSQILIFLNNVHATDIETVFFALMNETERLLGSAADSLASIVRGI